MRPEYRALFDERSAILEFDGVLTLSQAEARAIEPALGRERWLRSLGVPQPS
jgi:hypothetical protein